MKKYDVYSYWDSVIGQVWGPNCDAALETAKAEFGDDVYVLPVESAK